MPLSTSLGHGGTGLAGDPVGSINATLSALATLANEIKLDHNAVLTKLDADVLVTDTDYAATLTIATVDVSGTAVVGVSGSGLSGDGSIQLARRIRLITALANSIRTSHNALSVKVAADASAIGITPITAAAVSGISSELGHGGTQLVGDAGVGQALAAAVALLNSAKTKHNAMLAALDTHADVTDTNYVSLRTVAAASA